MIKILKNSLLVSVFSICFVFNNYGMQPAAVDEDTLTHNLSTSKLANELFNTAVEQYEEDNLDSAIVLMQKAVKVDKEFANAYDILAMMLVEKEDVYSRVLAKRAIKKAIELYPNEAKYHLNYGRLMLEQGFRYNAKKRFEYIKILDPTNNDVYLELGRIYMMDMEYFKNMASGNEGNPAAFIDENLLRYLREARQEQDSGGNISRIAFDREESMLKIVDFGDYVKKSYADAASAFSHVLEHDSTNKDAFHNLALLSMEVNMFNKFVDYQKRIIETHPDDKDAHLFLGFGYHKQSKDDLAYSEYMRAKSLMEPDEKAVFEKIDYIVPSDKLKEYEKMSPSDKAGFKKTFWKQRDPLFLSEYNERELEHYTRVAYTNLKFGVKKMKLPGWKSNRGKIYIRYGPPNRIIKLKPEREAPRTNLGPRYDENLTEIWYYDDFTFAFEDIFRTGEFRFGGLLGEHAKIPLVNFPKIARIEYEKKPEKYVPEFEGKKFDFGYYTASFRGDNGKSLVEVYYAVPVNELEPKKEKEIMAANLKEGIFFFDEKWNDINKIVSKEKISFRSKLDSTKNYYLIGMEQLKIEPGEYNFAIEFQEEESKNTGTYRDKIKVDSYPFGELNISDILLASNIIPADEESKYTKNGLKIIPNPARLFQKNQLMNIYFEIYDLMVNPENKTKFVVEYKVSAESEDKKPIISRVFSKLGKFIGIKEGKQDITASYEYEGIDPTEKINLSIDMSATGFGIYELTITAKDLNNDKKVSKTIKFGVQNAKINYLF